MKIVLLSILFLMLCFIVSFGVCYFYHYYQGYRASTGVPYLGSFRQHLNLIKKSKLIQPGKTWIDLGSGDGKALRYFTKHLGAKKCIGYEINKQAVWTAKLKDKLFGNKNITHHYHNFIEQPGAVEWEKADIIYLYLFDHVMPVITGRIAEYTKKGTIIICNTFPLDKCEDITLKEEIDSHGQIIISVYQKV